MGFPISAFLRRVGLKVGLFLQEILHSEGLIMQVEEAANYIDAAVGGILMPDTVLPVQYYDTLKNVHQRPPEIRIMARILIDALDMIRGRRTIACGDGLYGTQSQITNTARKREEAYQWLRGYHLTAYGLHPDDPDYIYSCESICGFLGLDFGRLKKAVEANRIDFKQLRQAKQSERPLPANQSVYVPGADNQRSNAA